MIKKATSKTGAGKARMPSRPRVRMEKSDRMAIIIEAAITVLARRGFDQLTLADIAEEAGVSTALIIVHFDSKDSLLGDVLDVLGQAYFDCLQASQDENDDAATRLWKLVDAEFDGSVFTERQLGAWQALWTETNGRKPFLERFGEQTRRFTRLQIELCEELARHDPSPVSAEIRARLIDTALGGIWIELTSSPTPLDIDGARAMARALLAFIFPKSFTPDGVIGRSGA